MQEANVIELFKSGNNEEFDPTKPVVAKNGWKTRIICTDADDNFPIVGLVFSPSINKERLMIYDKNGKCIVSEYTDGRLDLVNI